MIDKLKKWAIVANNFVQGVGTITDTVVHLMEVAQNHEDRLRNLEGVPPEEEKRTLN